MRPSLIPATHDWDPDELDDFLRDLDHHDPRFVSDPWTVYERLRDVSPVHHSTRHGGFWLVSRYEDVRAAAHDWRSFTSTVVGITLFPTTGHREEPEIPLELDPPLHTRYRALVNPVFTPRRIAAMRDTIAAIADGLLDDLLPLGEVEVVEELAAPLTTGVLAELLALPIEDRELWIGWVRRLMGSVVDAEDAAAAAAEVFGYIDQLLAARRRQPTGDFVSMLVESEVDGHRLTDAEVKGFMGLLLIAGHETTTSLVGSALHHLARETGDRAALADDPGRIPAAVEEFLRFAPPIHIFGRNATSDVTLHGQGIAEGDIVALAYGSANRDPRVFPDPNSFRLDRPSNRHMAFGTGPHFCIAAAVARLELAVLLERFLARVGDFGISDASDVWYKPRGDARGFARLPLSIHGAS